MAFHLAVLIFCLLITVPGLFSFSINTRSSFVNGRLIPSRAGLRSPASSFSHGSDEFRVPFVLKFNPWAEFQSTIEMHLLDLGLDSVPNFCKS